MPYLKYKFLYTTIVSLLVIYCNAQTNDAGGVNRNTTKKSYTALSGKITDAKTGIALAGASVFIHDLNKGAISKEDGSYLINNIPPARYVVEVSYIGYSADAQTIDIRSDLQQDFSLQPTAVEQEAVTVTGVSSATRIKQ